MRWLAGELGLGAAQIAELDADAAGAVFRATVAKAIADGRVDENEAARLRVIAAHAGLSVGDMMTRFCKKEGDALLRSIFSEAASDGQLDRRAWAEFRQRVWQRYGGRCAECGSDAYLEFDHVIPVAKGGGNSGTNVQLRSRKCKLAKSDAI